MEMLCELDPDYMKLGYSTGPIYHFPTEKLLCSFKKKRKITVGYIRTILHHYQSSTG